MEIRWMDIEAECGSYRDGFIAVFRKYEGRSTDEKDGHGRTVTVTMSSFARHMGIPETTFKGWVSRARFGRLPQDDLPTPSERLTEGIRNLSPERKAQVVEELIEEPAAKQAIIDKIARDPDLARAVAKDEGAMGQVFQQQAKHREPGQVTYPEYKEIAKQAADEMETDVAGTIADVNQKVASLRSTLDPDEAARLLLDQAHGTRGIVRSLGESLEYLGEVHRLATASRKPQVVG